MSLRIFELTRLGIMLDHNDIINFMGFEHKISNMPMTHVIDKCQIVSFAWRKAIKVTEQKTNIPVIELDENNKTRECMSKDIDPNGKTHWVPNLKLLINTRYVNVQQKDDHDDKSNTTNAANKSNKSEKEMHSVNKEESCDINYEFTKFEVSSLSELTETELFNNLYVIVNNKPSKASELCVMQLIRNLDKLYIRKELSLEAKLKQIIQNDSDLAELKDDPFINSLSWRNDMELKAVSKLINFIQSNR